MSTATEHAFQNVMPKSILFPAWLACLRPPGLLLLHLLPDDCCYRARSRSASATEHSDVSQLGVYQYRLTRSPLTEKQMRGTCSCHRILWDFYCRRNQCHRIFYGPGDLTVEVINVHVPSRKKKLTDEQSKILLRSLLQSNSDSMPGQTVGSARFLIGGDINMA